MKFTDGSSTTRTISMYIVFDCILLCLLLLTPILQWYVQRAGEGYHFKNVEAGKFASVNGTQNGSKVHGSGNPTTWDLREKNGRYLWVHPKLIVCRSDLFIRI